MKSYKVLHIFTIINTAKAFFDGQFSYLASNNIEMTIMSSSEEDKDFCKRNNVSYVQTDIKRRVSPFGDVKTIYKLINLIRKEKYDAVIGHTPKGAMIAMIASKLAGTALRIYYRHGLIYTTSHGIYRKILKFVEQLTSACANRIVNVSPSLSKLAVSDHLNSENKQIVIGYGTCGGIDCQNLFNPDIISNDKIRELQKSLNISIDDIVIGFCGRLCKDKGIRELIDGFLEFKEKNPSLNLKLLLVGPYDDRDILPDEYKQRISDELSIIHVGRIKKQKLPLYYSLMTLFMFPSYREGFGMTVIEANAMGIPALVSKSHGCIDSIDPHISGEYLEEISPTGIVEGLDKMIHSNLLSKLSGQSREVVIKKYDQTIVWPKILKLYKSGFALASWHYESLQTTSQTGE